MRPGVGRGLALGFDHMSAPGCEGRGAPQGVTVTTIGRMAGRGRLRWHVPPTGIGYDGYIDDRCRGCLRWHVPPTCIGYDGYIDDRCRGYLRWHVPPACHIGYIGSIHRLQVLCSRMVSLCSTANRIGQRAPPAHHSRHPQRLQRLQRLQVAHHSAHRHWYVGGARVKRRWCDMRLLERLWRSTGEAGAFGRGE